MNNFLINTLRTFNLNSVFHNPNISLKTNAKLTALAASNQTLVPVPPHEQTTIITKLSDLPEQPYNPQIFFRHLRANNHWNKKIT